MKRNSLAIVMCLAILLPVAVFAQTPAAVTPAKPVESPNQTVLGDGIKTAPLSVRRQNVEAQLRGILTQFTSIYTRTAIAVDRLEENNIDTDKARVELSKANLALTEAKTNIDAFAKIPVTDDAVSAKATSFLLRDSVKKAEDSLKAVRDALIQTLTHLKVTISASSDAQ